MNTIAFKDYEILSNKLDDLKEYCADLSSILIRLASEIELGHFGDLKSTSERILSLDMRFEAYKQEVMLFAGVSDRESDAEAFTTLQSMEPLLQSFYTQAKQEALYILNEVQSILHKDGKEFLPLQDCQMKARALQQSIAEIEPPRLHPDVPSLIDGSNPFSELLALIQSHKDLDEDELADRENRLDPIFGKRLFLALVRGKLSLPMEQVGEPAAAPQPASPNIYVIDNKPEAQRAVRESSSPAKAADEKPLEQMIHEAPVKKPAEIIPKPETQRAVRESFSPAKAADEKPPAQMPSDEPVSKPAEILAARPQDRDRERDDLSFKQMLKKEKMQEGRDAIQKDLAQTRSKLERALKYDFIEKNEYEWLGSIIQDIETLLPVKMDFRDDQKKLLSVRSTLDEKELNAIETRRRAMRQEFQQISNS